jgi:hypothetical protein
MNEIICPIQTIMKARVPSRMGRLLFKIDLVIVVSMVVSPSSRSFCSAKMFVDRSG